MNCAWILFHGSMTKCHTEEFKLYKHWRDTSHKGEFIHAKNRYYCGTSICVIDPENDVVLIPRIQGSLSDYHHGFITKLGRLIYYTM